MKGSSTTVREQLQGFKDQHKNFDDPRLHHGECPQEFWYLWEWFHEIGSEFSWTELHAWSMVTNRTLQRFEITTLLKLNNERVRASK
jgi:hypothetical protein